MVSSTCRRSFVSPDKPLDIALYASYEELRAVCQTWGLFGVKELASRSAAVLAEAIATLDTALRMHEPLLQRLRAEYVVRHSVVACSMHHELYTDTTSLHEAYGSCNASPEACDSADGLQLGIARHEVAWYENNPGCLSPALQPPAKSLSSPSPKQSCQYCGLLCKLTQWLAPRMCVLM